MKTILGIGNAITDIPVVLPDNSLLGELGFAPGSMSHVDTHRAAQIWERIQEFNLQFIQGGSAANTIAAASKLGMQGGFIGKVGDDRVGEIFREGLQKSGVVPYLYIGNKPSGKAVTFITPPCGERTFATCLGAALEQTADELEDEMFDGYDYLHVEGYLLQCPGVVERAMEIAKRKGMTISFDMGSWGIVRRYREAVNKLIAEYADIVFANEQEAGEFTGKEPQEALHYIAAVADIAVVKLGAEGSLVQSGNDFYRIKPYRTEVVDTTGAGDVYAAGFLYAHAKGADLCKCGECGSWLASKVVSVIGPKIPEMEEINLDSKII